MGVQSYPAVGATGRNSKAGGDRSNQSDTSAESSKHPTARTLKEPIVSRRGWPSGVPKLKRRPGKGRTSRSDASPTIPEQTMSTSPSKEEAGGSQHTVPHDRLSLTNWTCSPPCKTTAG